MKQAAIILTDMRSFVDFDAWGEAVRGASLRLACDAVETPVWTLGAIDLEGAVLQVASEGGGNLCYGANTHAGLTVFVPLTHAVEHVVNGETLDEDSLLAIPCGADFTICVRRTAHAWCSIALPDGIGGVAGAISGSARVAGHPGSVRALRRLVNAITANLLDRQAGTAARRTAGSELIDAVLACLRGTQPARPAVGRPRLDRATIIRRAMEAIENAPMLPTAADIALHVGVNERTLLRTFRESFGMPPKKYLILRQLHRIRRILSGEVPEHVTVADVLSRHGIWEFGRFAGRYRRHFGELPSQTLQRVRA